MSGDTVVIGASHVPETGREQDALSKEIYLCQNGHGLGLGCQGRVLMTTVGMAIWQLLTGVRGAIWLDKQMIRVYGE